MQTPTRLFALLVFLVSAAASAEPPPLERIEAQLVLEQMQWREVKVLAIQQGLDARQSFNPIFATVVAMAKRDGRDGVVRQTLCFDPLLGWHYLEVEAKRARLWTRLGYKEIFPWTQEISPQP